MQSSSFLRHVISQLTGQIKQLQVAADWQRTWIDYLHNIQHYTDIVALKLPPELQPQIKLTAGQQWSTPVSWFKIPQFDEMLWPNHLRPAKTFYSSGTTHSLKRAQSLSNQRLGSQSHFSVKGLSQYKITSILQFIATLARTPWPLEDFCGLSLIAPQQDQWRHSSLAQMIAWFGECFPLDYVTDAQHLEHALRSTDQPCWVFATAAHWSHITTPLQISTELRDKIYVFETGGFKHTTISSQTSPDLRVRRQWLYRHIQHIIGVDLTHIGSEYSASELAAQAWSFMTPSSSSFPLQAYEHPYYFPPYVAVAVEPLQSHQWLRAQAPQSSELFSSTSSTTSSTIGELCIYDPLRCDFQHAMNTEDLVLLSADGGFWPLGRSLHHDHKGCSLRVEDISEPPATRSAHTAQITQTTTPFVVLSASSSPRSAKSHLLSASNFRQELLIRLHNLMSSQAWLEALTHEFHDLQLAQQAAHDLLTNLPATTEQFAAALEISTHNAWLRFAEPQRVLMLAPRSHSLATLYHLCFLLAHGLAVVIRIPAPFLQHSCLRLLCNELIALGSDLSMVDERYYLTHSSQLHEFDGMIAFGTDHTLAALKQWCPGSKLLGFGTRYGVSVITAHPPNSSVFDRAWVDLSALAQRGCMSSQMIFLPQHSSRAWFEYLTTLQPPLTSMPHAISLRRRQRQLQSELQPHRLIHQPWDSAGARCGIMTFFDMIQLNSQLINSQLFADLTFIWPTVFYHDVTTVISYLCSDTRIGYVATDMLPEVWKSTYQGDKGDMNNIHTTPLTLRGLGKLNQAPWDGQFECRPMFSLPPA